MSESGADGPLKLCNTVNERMGKNYGEACDKKHK